MFLRCSRRVKDGKVHAYWNLVENRRLADGRVAQRQVLYLGEINASQREAWRKTVEVQEQGARRQVARFPAGSMPADDADAIGVRLSELRVARPRQWGACWLALDLWQQLELDSFWRARLRPSREGTPWLKVLKTLVTYRLIDPGSEWRLHRQWFDASAMADLLDSDFALAEKNTLYRCLDRLVEHKDELFKFLKRRWGELFGAQFDVLLYDLSSTYFESDVERGPEDLRQFGYSRDKRGDCRQVVIALIVTPEGFPLSYEVLAGNTADSTTLSDFLDRIERRYGRANRIWVMDRGIPTEESLAKMRAIGASYLVGTPKGRLTKLEQAFLGQPWARVREGVQVKRLATEEDVYVLAQSDARIDKERGMRRKRLRRYVDRLQALQGQALTRDQLLMKLGAARHEAGRAANLVQVTIPKANAKTASLEFELDRAKLRQVRRREGRYLLRTNLGAQEPERLWTFYIQLTEVEQAFKELKHDLAVRPIFHHSEDRIEAHIFVAFLAYCLQVTLKANLRPLAGGITPREVIAKFKTMQMVDVCVPTTDGRELMLSRYTQPEPEHRVLLQRLQLRLPEQPPPKIMASQARQQTPAATAV
ncbi:IS1634 family transposase [Piscinibacter sp.]|jgi:transposase|uniref:IS1634 family transposase n=1 Tax=Piscinibacter sp. TaxID=1903157 RepID=UPI003559E24A